MQITRTQDQACTNLWKTLYLQDPFLTKLNNLDETQSLKTKTNPSKTPPENQHDQYQ